MVMKYIFCFATAIFGFMTSALHAVEIKPVTISDKWAVVGVITSSNPKNDVAVLKNNETSKTYTVTIGDTLPSDYSYVLKRIERRSVTVSDGEKLFVLSFVDEPVAAEEADEFQDSVRFIDNYYRGLAESPIELFNKGRVNDTTGTAAVVQKNFGTLSESAKSRFENYNRQFEEIGQYYEFSEQEPASEENLSEYTDLPLYDDQQEVLENEVEIPLD
jgi:hypothetical protein